MNRHNAWTSAILVLLCAAVSQAPAATLIVSGTPNLLGFDAIPVTIRDDQEGIVVEGPDGRERWTGTFNTRLFNVEWDLEYQPDPGLIGTVTVTNNQPVTMFFSTETGVVSTVAVPAPGVMSGSSEITLISNGVGTATVSAPFGDSIYQGKIGGTTQRELFGSGYSFSITPPDLLLSDSATPFLSESTSTSLPIGGVVSLRHAFLLTSFDTAIVDSSFFVDVPSPTGSVLLWIGALGLCFCRRRRTLR